MTPEIITLMKQLQFHETTASLYALILVDGALSLKDISVKLNQPSIYLEDYLAQLLHLRLVSFDRHHLIKKLYYATIPSPKWR